MKVDSALQSQLAAFEGLHPAIAAQIAALEPSSVEASSNVIYAIWPDGRIALTNAAFDSFAHANGAPWVPERWDVGASVYSAMSADLREYYDEGWRAVLETGEVWTHTYECSTADEMRLYHMMTFRLPGETPALLIVNSLAYAGPHDRIAQPPVEARYRDAEGILHQCANCRRVRSAEDPKRWDWVPDWVRQTPVNTSHGVCPICFAAYYSPQLRALHEDA